MAYVSAHRLQWVNFPNPPPLPVEEVEVLAAAQTPAPSTTVAPVAEVATPIKQIPTSFFAKALQEMEASVKKARPHSTPSAPHNSSSLSLKKMRDMGAYLGEKVTFSLTTHPILTTILVVTLISTAFFLYTRKLHAKLQAEKEKALQEAKATHQEALAKAQHEHAAALENVQSEHAAALTKAQSEQKATLTKTQHEAAIAKLQEEHAQALQEQKQSHTKAIEAFGETVENLHKAFDAIKQQNAQLFKKIEESIASYEEMIKVKDAKAHAEQLDLLKGQLAVELQQAKLDYETALREEKDNFDRLVQGYSALKVGLFAQRVQIKKLRKGADSVRSAAKVDEAFASFQNLASQVVRLYVLAENIAWETQQDLRFWETATLSESVEEVWTALTSSKSSVMLDIKAMQEKALRISNNFYESSQSKMEEEQRRLHDNLTDSMRVLKKNLIQQIECNPEDVSSAVRTTMMNIFRKGISQIREDGRAAKEFLAEALSRIYNDAAKTIEEDGKDLLETLQETILNFTGDAVTELSLRVEEIEKSPPPTPDRFGPLLGTGHFFATDQTGQSDGSPPRSSIDLSVQDLPDSPVPAGSSTHLISTRGTTGSAPAPPVITAYLEITRQLQLFVKRSPWAVLRRNRCSPVPDRPPLALGDLNSKNNQASVSTGEEISPTHPPQSPAKSTPASAKSSPSQNGSRSPLGRVDLNLKDNQDNQVATNLMEAFTAAADSE